MKNSYPPKNIKDENRWVYKKLSRRSTGIFLWFEEYLCPEKDVLHLKAEHFFFISYKDLLISKKRQVRREYN